MVTVVVPMRKGSVGFPGKNVSFLMGLPLYKYTLNAAIEVGAARIIVSTDYEESELDLDCPGVEYSRRPHNLTGSDSSMEDVLLDLIKSSNISGIICLLQVTTPLRKSSKIAEAIDIFKSGDVTLVMSTVKVESSVLKYGIVSKDVYVPINLSKYCFFNRQYLPEVHRPNGGVYVFDANGFLNARGFDVEKIKFVEMSESESIDIDSVDDLVACENYFSRKEFQK